MKVTRNRLRQIIQEEVRRTLSEEASPQVGFVKISDDGKTATVGSRVSGTVTHVSKEAGDRVRPYDFVIKVGGSPSLSKQFVGELSPGIIDMGELSGTIISIPANVGDSVTKGQTLFTVELD